MIRKSEYFEQTDRYINSELTQPELNEFEAQLGIDSDLAGELNLHLEVEQALAEQDIISLRNSLNQIVQNETEFASNENISVFDSFSFGLTEEFSSHKKSVSQLNADDIFNFGYSFPKIHLYQHKIAGKENIHQFYKEQAGAVSANNEELQFSAQEEELFADIQTALDETDITDIRANLRQIAQSMPAHNYSTEEIEEYIYNSMDSEIRSRFEEELSLNDELAGEVRLIHEIDIAGAEKDIMDLRASLNAIQRAEVQTSASIKEIEEYIHNELSDEELASFENELSTNQKLQDEISFIKGIDEALKESDIMQLRGNLQHIAGEIAENKQNQRSFAGRFNAKRIAISTVAACLVLLLGISGILSKHSSPGDIYQEFYNKYEVTGTARSVSANANKTLAEALTKYENQDYKAALELFNQVISSNPNNMAGHFYAGVSLQETGKYSNAINEYKTVINNKDNLFTEQAEWYTGLCLLQTNEDKKAFRIFKKIAKNEGFYQQKALEILKNLKYTE